MQKVSQLVQNNQTFNSNSYKNLSPVMKEAITDVMKLVDNKTDDLLKTFETAVTKVAEQHNVDKDDIEEYFDISLKEQLEE